MFRFLGTLAAAACLMLGLGLGQRAAAQPAGAIAFAPLSAGLTIDGVQFTASDVEWDGVSYNGSTACNSSNVCLYMVAGSGPDPSVIIEAAIGSTLAPIDSYTCSTTSPDYNSSGGYCINQNYDLSGNLTATVLSGAPITGASVSLTGSTPAGDGSVVSIEEGLSGAPGCGALDTDLASGTASCTFTSASTSVTGNKDVGLGFVFPDVGTYALQTVTEGFTRVPEPASLASLLFGVIALAAARKATRHS